MLINDARDIHDFYRLYEKLVNWEMQVARFHKVECVAAVVHSHRIVAFAAQEHYVGF